VWRLPEGLARPPDERRKESDMEATTETMKPHKVTGLDLAFGGDMAKLLPKYDDIPEDFRRGRGDARKWIEFQQEWFFRGIKGAEFTPKAGIDKAEALAHLKAIQGSWEPKHEHKKAAVAWLASLWFDDIKLPASAK